MFQNKCNGKHRWPRGGCEQRLLAHDGTREMTTCNECLATKVSFRITVKDPVTGEWVAKESEFVVEPNRD